MENIMFDEDITNLDWYMDDSTFDSKYLAQIDDSSCGYRVDLNKILAPKEDSQYILEMYPSEAKVLSGYAKEAVDMADYRQSFIYDEYPDKLLFYQMVEKVFKRYLQSAEKRICKGHSEIEIKCIYKCMKEMTQIIVANEICNKRSRKNAVYFGTK